MDTSRITVSRLLSLADDTCGVKIFHLVGRSYSLTAEGKMVAALAEDILSKSAAFTSTIASQLGGLTHAIISEKAGESYVQQHKVDDVWDLGPADLKECIAAWGAAKGFLESKELKPIRDQMLVMRRQSGRWIFVEIGAHSAMAEWLGDDIAKSAIGRPIVQNYLGEAARRYLIPPLEHLLTFGGIWYDHVSAIFPIPGSEELERVNYQRVLLHCRFPDRSPALVSLVSKTDNLQIAGAIEFESSIRLS